jgi:hypothetical protein
MAVFFAVRQVPMYCNVLCPTRDAVLRNAWDGIRLGWCPACQHIANLALGPVRLAHARMQQLRPPSLRMVLA